MSLLSVTVKKARYVSIPATQFNTYVTLKLQNVKSTTVTVKGPTPCWEQDFLFEINDINLGLLVEVWNKGVIWDRALGYHYLPLTSVVYNEECGGRWIELEAQLMMRGGAVVGTTGSTGHALFLDCRFEPPFDAEGTGGADLQRKLDLLNGALDAERAEQARRQMQYIAHSGYSEDSDYTSDLNYPVGQHPNCSASQFRNAAHQMHTPQRSLEASRENSYERDEYHMHGDTDTLYYNSQPRNNRIDTWSQFQPELRAQASVESAVSWRTAADWQSGEDQRRPSLERQTTLYDDMAYGYDYTSMHLRDHAQISQQQSYEEYYDSTCYSHRSHAGDDSRQWDSGGRYFFDDTYPPSDEYESAASKRRASVVQLPQVPQKQLPESSRYSDFSGMAPYRPRQRRTPASLPATPSSTPKRGRALPLPPTSGSMTGSRGGSRSRRLPQLPYAPPPLSAVIVPYRTEPKKATPDMSYSYDSFRYQPQQYHDTTNDYQDYNNTSCDEDGMQPFFDETPHATPPAAVQKLPWMDTEVSLSQYSYAPTIETENVTSKNHPNTVASYLPQLPIMSQQGQYQADQYQFQQDDQYGLQQNQYHQQDYQHDQQYQPKCQEQQSLYQQQPLQYQEPNHQYLQQHQQQHHIQQQQQKQPTQQLQTTVMTGAATLGSLVAGGAKKLGSFFGAAAAAVAPPVQPSASIPHSASSITTFTPAVAPVTPFTSAATTMPVVPSVPEALPSMPVSSTVTSSPPVSLPRTPSLRRQESIQRPPVRRIPTLPDAPEELVSSIIDESAYGDEYPKTEYDEPLEHDRVSLRYSEDEYVRETLHEESVSDTRKLSEEFSHSELKTISPARNGAQLRKPSVDSYHVVPPELDRRTSQSSFHREETPLLSAAGEEVPAEKSKVTFQEERTTYHEVPEETDEFHDVHEDYDEIQSAYHDETENFRQQGGQFHDDHEKFDEQDDQFNESEEAYHEDENVFQDDDHIANHEVFQEKQPKLTPRQRWHRAYNKIVIQLNTIHPTQSVAWLRAIPRQAIPTYRTHYKQIPTGPQALMDGAVYFLAKAYLRFPIPSIIRVARISLSKTVL